MTVSDNQNALYLVGMVANPFVGRVWRLADPLCQDEGMELVHVEYHRESGGRILRVYIDKTGGVTLDDCVAISRQLSDLLDVNLDTEASYSLEVSSPGMQRPLGKLSDFERFKGCKAKVRTTRTISGQKSYTGILDGTCGQSILILIDNQPVTIVLADIAKAHLINYNGETTCS